MEKAIKSTYFITLIKFLLDSIYLFKERKFKNAHIVEFMCIVHKDATICKFFSFLFIYLGVVGVERNFVYLLNEV